MIKWCSEELQDKVYHNQSTSSLDYTFLVYLDVAGPQVPVTCLLVQPRCILIRGWLKRMLWGYLSQVPHSRHVISLNPAYANVCFLCDHVILWCFMYVWHSVKGLEWPNGYMNKNHTAHLVPCPSAKGQSGNCKVKKWIKIRMIWVWLLGTLTLWMLSFEW